MSSLTEAVINQGASSNKQIVQEHLLEILELQGKGYRLRRIYAGLKEVSELKCTFDSFKSYVYKLKASPPSSTSEQCGSPLSQPTSSSSVDIPSLSPVPVPVPVPVSSVVQSKKRTPPLESDEERLARLRDRSDRNFDREEWKHSHPYGEAYPGYPWRENLGG